MAAAVLWSYACRLTVGWPFIGPAPIDAAAGILLLRVLLTAFAACVLGTIAMLTCCECDVRLPFWSPRAEASSWAAAQVLCCRAGYSLLLWWYVGRAGPFAAAAATTAPPCQGCPL